MLRARGIGYDTGFSLPGTTARAFDPAAMRRELEIIGRDLHCNAVRLFGNDLDRLEFAAGVAAELGLEIWFSPYPYELEPAEMLDMLADAARRAERICRANADVVLVAGAEISLFNRGFLPGATLAERTGNLLQRRPEALAAIAGLPSQINSFLDQAVRACRNSFEGKITYASVPFEKVDWAPFDILSVDAHRSKEVAPIYQQAIRSLVAQGKPVAITEFGCTTYRGAADHGARGGEIAEYEGVVPVRLDGVYIRDEEEQANYLRELLDVFVAENVDAAFVCTFACWDRPHAVTHARTSTWPAGASSRSSRTAMARPIPTSPGSRRRPSGLLPAAIAVSKPAWRWTSDEVDQRPIPDHPARRRACERPLTSRELGSS